MMRRHPILAGIVLAAFTVSQILALVSFHPSCPSMNLLGLFGHISGYLWLLSLGPVCLCGIALLGTQAVALMKKDLSYTSRAHVLYACGLLISLALMLCVLSTLCPSMQTIWDYLLGYPEVWFPLGGVPMTWWYGMAPYISLEHILGSTGTLLCAGTLFLLSFILLGNVDVTAWFTRKPRSTHTPAKLSLIHI